MALTVYIFHGTIECTTTTSLRNFVLKLNSQFGEQLNVLDVLQNWVKVLLTTELPILRQPGTVGWGIATIRGAIVLSVLPSPLHSSLLMGDGLPKGF